MPRLNLEISETQMNSLRALEARTGANSMKELVNNALTLLEWAVDETANFNEIAAVNEENETYRVMVMPFLKHVSQEAHKRAAESEEPVSVSA